nr:hypothetical protein [Tanacetum cinerariifolium]
MTLELHRQFVNYSPYEMLQELSSMFEKQAGVERFDIIQTFYACKQEEGKSVAPYVLQMKGYVDQLERLGYVLPQYIIVGLFLNGLTKDFAGFVRNYNMHNMGKTIGELHAMLIEPYAKEHPTKDDACHHCKEVGHWKMNSPVYLAEFEEKKASWLCQFFSTKRAKHNLDSTYLWHCRLAHISKKRIEKLQKEGLLRSTDDESFDQCVSCLSGKMTRKSFPHRLERATDLIGIIHTYVCGPLRHVSRQVFKKEVKNQLGKTIKALRSDRGGEYISQKFKDYFKACGIVQQLTPPYTPQHNGVSKRINRTLLDMVRSMMNHITLLLSFWDYALESVTRILNMVPTKKVDKTSYELWYGKVPNLSYLKVWGCEALVKRDTPDKLQQRPIVVARYAEFFEKNLLTQEVSGRAMDLVEIQDEDTSPSEITSKIPMEVEGFEPPQEEVIPICRSKMTHRAPNSLCLNVEVEEHSLGDLNEPSSYKAAMLDSESNSWIDAMNAKIQSMINNMVWVLVDLPPGCKTVG